MPAAGALAALSALPDVDPVRDALLSRVPLVAAAWAAQDAEFEAESAALAAAGAVIVPDEVELAGLVPDPASDPPDGVHGWLADMPGPLINEYLAATTETAGQRCRGPGSGDAPRVRVRVLRRMNRLSWGHPGRCWPALSQARTPRAWAG